MAEPSVVNWQVHWKLPLEAGENLSRMEQESGGTEGDIWGWKKLFQITQNCWEPNWQSKTEVQ